MKKDSEATRLKIYFGESDQYDGKPLYKYLLECFKKEGLAGATVYKGIAGFGKSSHMHTVSILRLSDDLPMILEVVDRPENIEKIKPKLEQALKKGLVTEETIKVWPGDKEG